MKGAVSGMSNNMPNGIAEGDMFAQMRGRQPVIHCITNYVTANDVANMILAAGGSPIMADGSREAEDITKISHGLVINIGTLKEAAIESMLIAGRCAAGLGHPIVLDPVGVGASAFRRETAVRILEEVPISVIRGNASEIRALIRETSFSRGVDADRREALTKTNRRETAAMVQEFSRQTGAVIAMTGATDLVADGERVCLIENGSPMMSRITVAGCMLDGVVAVALASSGTGVETDRFRQTVRAVAAVGICGELAEERTLQAGGGTGSFRMHFIDAMSRLTDKDVADRIQLIQEDV